MNRTSLFAVAVVLILAGCSTPEVLAPRASNVPAGVDLSGNWRIRPGSLLDEQRVREAIRKTDGVDDSEAFGRKRRQSQRGSARSSNRSNSRGGLVYVFLELGRSLKVTQTPHGLFISFDRSIVEEYRFGEDRIATIGEIAAQRVTGWEGGTLVIETLDRNDMKLTERFRLTDNNQILERTITLRSKALEEETVIQTFDRVAN
jgi:hypothetical protein